MSVLQPFPLASLGVAPVPEGASLGSLVEQNNSFAQGPQISRTIQEFFAPHSGATRSGGGSLFSWLTDPVRAVTLILGLLLIAAALFSHPAVRERVVTAGKAAGKAAALAA